MKAIMPRGYSVDLLRKKLEKELHQAKAAELAQATPQDRKRIEKEIEADVSRQVREYRATLSWVNDLLWWR
jgi:hypothetical protein